jgi:hypothetical protein
MSSSNNKIALVGLLASLLWSASSSALSLDPAQSTEGLAAAISSDGAAPEAIGRYAAELLGAGVSYGDAAEVLLKAGYSTQHVVSVLLEAGGNAAVIDVVSRVLHIQGDAVMDLVRAAAYAVPGIDKDLVDRAIAIYLGKAHLPIRDPGATKQGELPDRPVSNF